MKKIYILISCLLLLTITGCTNNKNAPEFWEQETQAITQGEYNDLTEEYYSYVKSVQSQFEKQNGIELKYKYVVPIDESAKKFTVYFEEKSTQMEFYIDCTRNNINATNYKKATLERKTLEGLEKSFISGKHIHKDLEYGLNDLENIFDFEFEIFTDDMEVSEDYIYNPKYKKILRITMDTNRLKNHICNEVFFNRMKATLGSYASVELKDYDNVEIQTTIKNCGFIRLNRFDGENAIEYSKYAVIN